MMKKILIGAAAVVLLLLVAAAAYKMLGYHRITAVRGADFLTSCPSFARKGTLVSFETVSVCDADIFVYVDGGECTPVRDGYYEFVMPDKDVSIEVAVVSNGLA